MANKNEAVFFCSAFNDISYILAEIEHKKFEYSLIYIINNIGAYQFFKSLKNKNIILKFIKTKLNNNSNPIHWLKEFIYIHFYLYFKFRNISNLPVYFYATFYDKIAMYAAFQLKNKNKLILGYSPAPGEFFVRKKRFYDIMNSILYCAPINSYTSTNFNVSGLSMDFVNNFFSFVRNVHISEHINIQNKYAYKFYDNKPFILLLSSKEDEGVNKVHTSAKKIFSYIINQFKYQEIYLKAHPRIGHANFITNYKLHEVPSYVPIEFIDFTNCKLVIGIYSISLSNIASKGVRTISLIQLIDFTSDKIRLKYIEYLNINCLNYKIHFPISLYNLQTHLNQIKFEFNYRIN